MKPRVSLIVPCHNYARFLPDCIDSVLCQTWKDYEVLILDDCSTDDTPQVAQSFKDERIRYIRNETNLGAARNFNKGIELSRGEYLAAALSADDRLGQPNALARFVEFLDGHPTVGYVMSNIMTFETGKPAAPSAYHYQVKHDRVIPRREWLTRMAVSCYLLFSITRKECYEKYGRFPEDMRVNFDWQLGCLHAFHYDVGIIAEPLFHYRIHQQALSQGFGTPIDEVIRLDVLVRLRMRQKALELGENEVARAFEHEMVAAAARRAALQIGENSPRGFSVEQFEEVLKAHFDGQELPHGLVEKVQRAVPTALEASAEYWHGQGNAAEMGRYYKLALKEGGWNSRVAAKATLARMGKPGQWLRALLGRPRVEQK